MSVERARWNRSRFIPGDVHGFYESYFQRANHPTRPLAFWIRYTVFSPRGQPELARGELWAIYFDGESQRVSAAKQTVPMADCEFSRAGMDVRIGRASLDDQIFDGGAASATHAFTWSLRYRSSEPPLLLLPEPWYARRLPRAKALTGSPNAIFDGMLTVDGTRIAIDGWRGSQNHNWGSQHTDRYAWAQVAGFDDAPDSFLECGSAQLRVAGAWTPSITLLVLRDQGEELAINGLWCALRATAKIDFFDWRIDTRNAHARVHGRVHAPASAFVGLTYDNPPGGSKTCLNCKLASAEFTIERPGRPARTLVTRQRAAFEILTDRTDHAVAIVA